MCLEPFEHTSVLFVASAGIFPQDELYFSVPSVPKPPHNAGKGERISTALDGPPSPLPEKCLCSRRTGRPLVRVLKQIKCVKDRPAATHQHIDGLSL